MSKQQATNAILRIEHATQLLRNEVITAIQISTEQQQVLYEVATLIERAEKRFQKGFRKWEEGELVTQERPTIVKGVSID